MEVVQNSKNNKNALWLWRAAIAFLLFGLFFGYPSFLTGDKTPTPPEEIEFSKFLDRIEAREITSVTVTGDEVVSVDKSGKSFKTRALPYPNFVDKLRASGVTINSLPPPPPNFLRELIISVAPTILFIGIAIYLISRLGGKNNPLTKFRQSKARLLTEQRNRMTFADVAGVEEAKQEVREVVEFLQNPDKFRRLGGKIPKGVLLVGPPGTGKTLLARAVAGEANVPFFYASGSEFVEMFVGVGASRVRDMFELGKKNAPCIIFIDEIDSLGRHRGAGIGHGNDEKEQTLNQFLAEVDGFEANEGLIIIGATNRPDVLDPALLRPGRFDRTVVVELPDRKGREEILKVHIKKASLSPGIDLSVIARGTPGFSGADIANLVNEAALLAARKNKRIITTDDFEEARDKIVMGVERRSFVMGDEERSIVAHHEAGHVVVSHFVPGNDPVHKVTIIPRGRGLGVTMRLPEKDHLFITKEKAKALLAMLYGGRAPAGQEVG